MLPSCAVRELINIHEGGHIAPPLHKVGGSWDGPEVCVCGGGGGGRYIQQHTSYTLQAWTLSKHRMYLGVLQREMGSPTDISNIFHVSYIHPFFFYIN